jgi:hypothetical protein
MQKLSITKRPGQLKGSIASRPELHGDDVVGALTVSICNILLYPDDLKKMYNDEDAHSRLFKKSDAGLVPAQPGTLLVLTEIFKGAKVTLTFDDRDSPLILKPATVKEILLEPQDAGGHVLMSCKVLGAPPDDDEVNPLHILTKKCKIAILNGAIAGKEPNENQGELPLDPGDSPEGQMTEVEREEAEATAEAGGDDEGESSIGKQIRRSETKKKRAGRKNVH